MKPDPPKTVASLRAIAHFTSSKASFELQPLRRARSETRLSRCEGPTIRAGTIMMPNRAQQQEIAVDFAGSVMKIPAFKAAHKCPGGGIGRRAGFRYLWPKGRESSSLFLGTIRRLLIGPGAL